MTATGQIESWVENPLNIGPLYPFVGWEVTLFVLCFALCAAFTIWKIVHEKKQHDAEAQDLRQSGNVVDMLESAYRDYVSSKRD